MTELMVLVTGLRAPRATLTYRGETGAVLVNGDDPTAACYYCGRGSACD